MTVRSRARQGVLLVALSCLWFGAANVMIRAAGDSIPVFQVAFLRSLLGVLPVAFLLRREGIPFGTRQWRLMVVRGLSGMGAILSFFWALIHIPIATAVMFNYTAPVFATVFAILFMGERLRLPTAASLAVAFAGMVLMLRPTFGGGSALPYLVGLSAGLFSATSFIVIKRLTREEPVWRIILWFNLTASLGTLPFCLGGWVWPDANQWALLVGIAAAATAGQMLMTAGFERGPVSLTGATSLLTVVTTAVGGWAVFGETVGPATLAGMALVGLGVLGLAFWANEESVGSEEPTAG